MLSGLGQLLNRGSNRWSPVSKRILIQRDSWGLTKRVLIEVRYQSGDYVKVVGADVDHVMQLYVDGIRGIERSELEKLLTSEDIGLTRVPPHHDVKLQVNPVDLIRRQRPVARSGYASNVLRKLLKSRSHSGQFAKGTFNFGSGSCDVFGESVEERPCEVLERFSLRFDGGESYLDVTFSRGGLGIEVDREPDSEATESDGHDDRDDTGGEAYGFHFVRAGLDTER